MKHVKNASGATRAQSGGRKHGDGHPRSVPRYRASDGARKA